MKKTFIRILCVLFAFIFSCVNATAAEIAVDIKEEITEAFGFPLHFESSYSDETLNAQISLREEFSEVEEYELNVRHWLLGGTILYEKVSGDEIIELYDIDFGHSYSLTLTLYYPDRIKYIHGTFVAELNENGVVFEFEHEQIDDIVNYYNYIDENAEMTDEEYDEVFEYLDIPSFIEKEKAKAFKHLVRLEEFKDSLTTIGFYNSDGTTTVYTFSNPVRYVDTDGTIKDYSADIVPAVESVEQKGYKYSNKFGEMTVNFSDQLSNSSGTEIISKHGTIEFGLFGAQQTQEQTVIDKLFDADINEATLTKDGTAQKVEYEGIGIDGVTIKSEPVIDGAKTSIIMSEVPQDNKIRIWVSTQNLLPIVDDQGRFVNFVDAKTNSILYRFGYVETRDNSSENCRFSIKNSVSIIGRNESKVLIEISLDEDLVYSPIATYPLETSVYLVSTEGMYVERQSVLVEEPLESNTRITASQNEMTLVGNDSISTYATSSAPPATDDGYYVTCYFTKETNNISDISIHSNGNVNAWDSAWLAIGTVGSYWTGTACVNIVSSTIMQYNSSSLSEMQLNVDRINFAEISLYGVNSTVSDFTVPVKIERLKTSWNETSVNSSILNQVDADYIGNDNDVVYSGEGERRLTVTQFVKDHLRYIKDDSTGIPNYGFRIITSEDNAPLLTFASKDHPDASKRPKLIITYEGYVFTPYENAIRIKTNEPYVRLDYGKTYSGIANHLVLLKKSGAPETSNVELEYRSLDEDMATVDNNGEVTANQTEGYAVIEVKRLDTNDCTYVTFDVSLHIEISKSVSQAVKDRNNKITEAEKKNETVRDKLYVNDEDIDYVIRISEKEWDYIQYDVLDWENPTCEESNAKIKANVNVSKYFTPQELKYLYKLDPNGVTYYVQQTSLDKCSGSTREIQIFNQVQYKNEMFKAIFDRPPIIYSIDSSNNLKEEKGVSQEDLAPSNIKEYCSESEIVFGIVNRNEDNVITTIFLTAILVGIGIASTFTIPLGMCYQLDAVQVLRIAASELIADAVVATGVYVVANIDGEFDSMEVATFTACLVTVVLDAYSLGSTLYGFTKMQKAILTSVNDGANISVSVDTQALEVKNINGNGISGKWAQVNESMSEFSRTYQTYITGKEGEVFVQNGVKFDGVLDGCLVETKGRYAQFVDKITGEFYEWFTGQKDLVDQAIRQLKAADGAQVCWYFAEETTMEATRKLFNEKGITNIKLIFAPLG